MKQLAITNRICEHLEKYVFDRVWNEPYTEFRTYTKPLLLNSVPVSGLFHGRYSQVQMPINENTTEWGRRYDVYSIESSQFRSVFLNATSWISLREYSTKSHLDLQLFTTTGICLHRDHAFITQTDMGDAVLLAVDHDMMTALCGTDFDPKNIIFGKYHESDYDWDNNITSSVVSYSNLESWMANSLKDPIPDGSIRLYNGRYVTGIRDDYLYGLKVNSFIEVIDDSDIIGKLIVPCYGDNVRWYHTSESGTRLLIHVPKSMNPENFLLTLNTCDVFLVPTKMSGDANPYLNGVLLYQCGREQYFHQLTHQDFSIDLSLIEEVARYHSFLQYRVEVIIRKHPRQARLNRTLIRDANYINYLYHPQHTDDDIVNFLLNKGVVDMPFWRADHLENGMYAQAIYSRRCMHAPVSSQCKECALSEVCEDKPNKSLMCRYYRNRSINDYIDILGYYQTLALIAKRITHYELTTDGISQFIVRGMIGLPDLTDTDYVAVVYHNGLKVNSEYVKVRSTLRESTEGATELFTNDIIVSDYSRKLCVVVTNTTFVKGDKVTIELYPDRFVNHVKHYKWSSTKYVLTEDPLFVASKDYYKLVDGAYVKDTTVVTDGTVPSGTYYELVQNTDNLKIQMNTEDQWKVYVVANHDNGTRTDVQYTLIEDPGTFDKTTKTLMVSMAYNSYNLVVVEGPYTINDSYTFNITTNPTTGTTPMSISYGYLGKQMYLDGRTKFDTFPGDSDVAFLNSKRLIEDLDYTLPNYAGEDTRLGAHFILQNVSYLRPSNVCEILRTSMTPIVYNRGFLNDDIINWDGMAPFWFDELSTLTIDGVVCSTFTRDLGRITIDKAWHHRNGAPFEICTSVPTQVITNVGHHGEEDDLEKMRKLREYFYGRHYEPPYKTIVPHEHKLYSIYLEKIIDEYLNNDEFDFEMLANRAMFIRQFSDFEWWKNHDLTYKLSEFQLQYVDVYPLYHRISTQTREDYTKLAYMIKMLSPAETIKHKDLTNVSDN